jgi:hypothetical protein
MEDTQSRFTGKWITRRVLFLYRFVELEKLVVIIEQNQIQKGVWEGDVDVDGP